jgi:hypothetical protein
MTVASNKNLSIKPSKGYSISLKLTTDQMKIPELTADLSKWESFAF